MAPLDDKPADGVDPYTATQWTNVELLVRTYGDRIRWVLWEKWLVWDGTCWARDRRGDRAGPAVALHWTGRGRSRDERKAAVKWAHVRTPVADRAIVALARTGAWHSGAARPARRRHDPADLIAGRPAWPTGPTRGRPSSSAFLSLACSPTRACATTWPRLFGSHRPRRRRARSTRAPAGVPRRGQQRKTTLVELAMSALGEYADLAEPDPHCCPQARHAPPAGAATCKGKRLVVATGTRTTAAGRTSRWSRP